jgi:hypothetical protein
MLTLREIGFRGRLQFLVGWAPPRDAGERQRSPRWKTYGDFLGEYTAVRDEMLGWRSSKPGDFAEELYQRVAADRRGDVEALGAALYAAKFPTDALAGLEEG